VTWQLDTDTCIYLLEGAVRQQLSSVSVPLTPAK
jgi:hypothetical protein